MSSVVSPFMKVTRLQIVARGFSNRCPNCGGHTLFKPGTLFEVNPSCPACGLKIERGEGFYLGSLSLNFGVTLVCFMVPIILLAVNQVIGVTTASVLAGVGALVFPALFYRSSRSWWLMNYYIFFPHQLPANQTGPRAGEDENI